MHRYVVALFLSCTAICALTGADAQQRGDRTDCTVEIWLRNTYGHKYISNVTVILQQSNGKRDSVLTDRRGVAIFPAVQCGKVIVWQDNREQTRDTLVVSSGKVERDTLMGARTPIQLYK